VLTFGRASVSTPARIRSAARRLADVRAEPAAVVAVLPAMGDQEGLAALAAHVSADPVPRELDLLLGAGERITCALCAMALLDRGARAVSLSGSQAGILTDDAHGSAAIVDVRPARIRAELATGAIVLVAGCQGVSGTGEVTRLAGDDTAPTALAIARALGASRCEAVPDDGVTAPVTLRPAETAPLPLERTA